jgi:hypothetical protein
VAAQLVASRVVLSPIRVTDLLVGRSFGRSVGRLFGEKAIQHRMSGYYDFRPGKMCILSCKYEYYVKQSRYYYNVCFSIRYPLQNLTSHINHLLTLLALRVMP